MVIADMPAEPEKETRAWARSAGSYIAGRAYVDEADQTAIEMETKWGVDRLRLLVSPELREKFDRQRYLFNQAIWGGELEDVKREAMRMVKAWIAVDKAAEGSGARKLSPLVWEIAVKAKRTSDVPNAFVAAIVRSNEDAQAVIAEGRHVQVYTLEEIANLLVANPAVAAIKDKWPGAFIVGSRKAIMDPLQSVHDMDDSLDGI